MQQALFVLKTRSQRNPAIHVIVSNASLFYPPCPLEIYLPSKMKVEPDLSLVWDEHW